MRAFLSLLMLALLFWLGSFVWFMQSLPRESVSASVKTDAIIVLTGGADRVEHGLEMLAEGAAPVLFISGVGAHVTKAQMLAAHASASAKQRLDQVQPEIVFDYEAATTQSNAEQALAFVRQRNIHSIRLITAHYHMPRSLLEFRRAMPDVNLVPDPVFPEGFKRNQWWQHDNTRRLLFSEYYKYYGAMLRPEKA
ncbi:MAG: YdcF family protein [Rickettsiales bacterium]